MSGCPASGRTFFPGTRGEPERAGTRATTDAVIRQPHDTPRGSSLQTAARAEPARPEDAVASNGSYVRRLVGHVDHLPVRVDVERLDAGLTPAGAGVPLAAEGHVRLEAVRRPV